MIRQLLAGFTTTMADIDWVDVNKRLPYKRTEEEKEKRKRLWRGIDINGNGYVSLAEITKVGISYRLIRRIIKENSWQCFLSDYRPPCGYKSVKLCTGYPY